MNFPQFWARGRSGDFFAWRWSATSLAEAQTLADQAAASIAERFRRNDTLRRGGGYYPNHPFREQILQEFKDTAGGTAALVTRNSYGCLVLNTARVMFVDIDVPEPKTPTLFQKLFGKTPAAPTVTQESALAKVEQWSRSNPEWGWRIYRTRAGLRLIATQGIFDATSADVARILDALGADPLYRKLCQTQKCFRARLTPKPWRCGVFSKPARWPYLDAKAEKKFERWETQYKSYSGSWATCEFIRHTGHATVHPEVDTIIKLHDEACRVGSNLKLA
jgi:hypothetical protein